MEEAHHRRGSATKEAAVVREMRQFGVVVPGGVECVRLRARTLHKTGNWLVITDCSKAFTCNNVKWTVVLTDGVHCVPALTPFVAKCYGTLPADAFFRVHSG